MCGLKPAQRDIAQLTLRSHPSWVCGLKLRFAAYQKIYQDVTPFVGVWIETSVANQNWFRTQVTPFVGVWIETPLLIF